MDGRNPAPVDRWFIPLFIGFQPSKVMQDFFHPQYDSFKLVEGERRTVGFVLVNSVKSWVLLVDRQQVSRRTSEIGNSWVI